MALMVAFHEACTGRKPSAHSLMYYRKLAKRGTWSKMHGEFDRTLASIQRNRNLRQTGQHLGMNESSKLYLFGE